MRSRWLKQTPLLSPSGGYIFPGGISRHGDAYSGGIRGASVVSYVVTGAEASLRVLRCTRAAAAALRLRTGKPGKLGRHKTQTSYTTFIRLLARPNITIA